MHAETRPVVEPAALDVDAVHGALLGDAERYEKYLRDLSGLYSDDDAYASALAATDGEPVYWVDSSIVERGDGALTIGVSVLRPGLVGDEFAMTRGHLHAVAEHAEMYFGMAGEGVMLLDSLDGRSRAVPIGPGTVVHVPGGWVHRSVNVGAETLVTLFCYATEAGQDYGLIERAGGMSTLIVASPDGWTARPNPRHKGYRD